MNGLEELILECKKGKASALNSLYDKYGSILLSVCMRYFVDRAEAEDVLQESFIKIFFNIKKFRLYEGGSFEGWMKRIAVNTALNHIRKKARNKNLVDFGEIEERYEDIKDDSFVEEDNSSLSQEELLELIQALPPGYKAVFNMFVFDRYSHKEIANELGISENTSKSQLSKARVYLQKRVLELQRKKENE